MGIISQYPYTDMHSINLDYIMKLCRENMGLHLEVSGNQILLKTLDGTLISSITPHYAETAGAADSATYANTAGSATSALTAASAAYATKAGSADTADLATEAAHATSADSATSALNATNAASATYAATAGAATNATNAVYAEHATLADTTTAALNATNAIQSVTLNGNELRFTTYGGTNIDVECPYSVKALKDDLGNTIKSFYIANVINDQNTGKLKFLDASGNTIVELTPIVNAATEDSYGNTIADFVKNIIVSSNSNYVTVDHGTGTSDTLTIHYSETAWKDTNGNIIKNSYVKRMECIVDPNDSKYKLAAYNGDTPEAEIFRIELTCENAAHAVNADYATTAGSATNATNAGHATTADSATNADHATTADSATSSSGDPIIVEIGFPSTATDLYSMNVGDDDDYTSSMSFSEIMGVNGFASKKPIQFVFLDEDSMIQISIPALRTGSGVTIMLYNMGVGPQYYKVSTGTAPGTINIERIL